MELGYVINIDISNHKRVGGLRLYRATTSLIRNTETKSRRNLIKVE